MCGRFALGAAAEDVAAYFDATPLPDALAPAPSWNIAPTTWVQAITKSEGRTSQEKNRVIQLMRWGFLPVWAKSLDAKPQPINARAEGARDKRMFGTAVKRYRCLIPASGWYEWRSAGREKLPHYFHALDDSMLSFAAIHSRWTQGGESLIDSFAILTTAAAKHIDEVHDRMPVLIAAADRDDWLDPNSPTNEIDDIMSPGRVHESAAIMDSYAVSKSVNKAGRNGPDLITPLNTLF